MTQKPENPSAFPESSTSNGYQANVNQGMTLRDYFAAKAMAAIKQSEARVQWGVMTNMFTDSQTRCETMIAALIATAETHPHMTLREVKESPLFAQAVREYHERTIN